MHKFSTAATKSSGVRCAPAALRDPQAGTPGLLNVPYSTFAGAPALARSALSSLRDKNLCINPARRRRCRDIGDDE